MNQLDNIMRGLEILKANDCNGISAEHDIIYANSYNELDADDTQSMKNFGWHFDESIDTWAHFV